MVSDLRIDHGERIVCGKFDDLIVFDKSIIAKKNKKVRIGSKNPNKLQVKSYTPIATNGKKVFFEDRLYKTREFLSELNISKNQSMIVLTNKEKLMILDLLVEFNIDIDVLELRYPIFNDIKYTSNVRGNYKKLKQLLRLVDKLEIKGNSLNHYLSVGHLFKIERKIRFKNNLDYFFSFAYRGGYQEVFKLKEERKDRVVIAFDFNSMFVECMKGDFVDPKLLEYKNYRGHNVKVDNLNCGIFKVILKKPKETFFNHFHPFKYNYLQKSYYFNLERNHEIEILLFSNEIKYYSKFFSEIEVLEGFFSKETIVHPLLANAKKIYKERLHYKKLNSTMSNLCKKRLITMHSATNPKRYKTLYFSNEENLINYLSLNYMISFPAGISFDKKLSLLENYKNFTFTYTKNGIKAKMINHDTNDSIFSLSSQILANSRIKMVETIEKFLRHDSVELCYANVDSLHISIKRSELSNFLFINKKIISDKLGDLKIQSISKKGYWFDVGRYWLFGKKKKVTGFKNMLFNHQGNINKFLRIRKLRIICTGKLFSAT